MYQRLLLLACLAARSAAPAHNSKTQLVARDGFTVDFRDSLNAVDQMVVNKMIDAFLASYPRLVAGFNSAAPRRVMSTAYRLDRNGYRGVVRKVMLGCVERPTRPRSGGS